MSLDQITDDAEAVREIVHWMVITAAHDPALLAVKGKFASELARNDDVSELQRLGCDKDKLLDTLAFANAMPALYPPLDANALRNLARDLKDIVTRMKRITPSAALLWIEESDGRQFLTWKPTGGDLHVGPELERELQLKAAVYKGLARLCRLRKIPSRATFRRFAFVWPLQYINSCTGEPHYAAASRLLCRTGIHKNGKQLKVAFLSALERYPSVLSWMELAASFLHDTGGSRPK
jgi:hypothetical protein